MLIRPFVHRQTLATAVVQLLTSDPPNHSKWTKYMTGVACFVRDNARRSYFIRVFDIDRDAVSFSPLPLPCHILIAS